MQDTEKKWYGIRVTYNRELKVKSDLEEKEIEHFLPMCYKEVVRREKKIKVLTPAVHNLIFIHCTKNEMIDYKNTTSLPIRYIMDPETRKPLVIPEIQMQNFIAVAGNYTEQIIYLDYNTAMLTKGQKVRVTGGIFAGVEGIFVKMKGDKRVVVILKGLAAIATAYIHPSLIEKIK